MSETTWSKEPPVPGWYWSRPTEQFICQHCERINTFDPTIVYLRRGEPTTPRREYWGPIPPPTESA